MNIFFSYIHVESVDGILLPVHQKKTSSSGVRKGLSGQSNFATPF